MAILTRSVASRNAIRTGADCDGERRWHGRGVKPVSADEHRQLCTIELVAEGHAERCPGEECLFWDRGCALSRIEHELDHRPAVARVLLDLRRELEAGREIAIEAAHRRFAHVLNEDEQID